MSVDAPLDGIAEAKRFLSCNLFLTDDDGTPTLYAFVIRKLLEQAESLESELLRLESEVRFTNNDFINEDYANKGATGPSSTSPLLADDLLPDTEIDGAFPYDIPQASERVAARWARDTILKRMGERQ